MTAAPVLAPVEWFSFEDRRIASRPGHWRSELRPLLRGFAGSHRADDIVLAASELVSNGVEHAGGVVAVRVTGIAGALRIEVEDRLPHMLERREQTSERGRGLVITAAVADAWGWHPTAHGKVVWACFDRTDDVVPVGIRSHDRRTD